MKLQFFFSVRDYSKQNITDSYKTNQSLNHLSQYFHWIPHSFLSCPVDSSFFVNYTANSFKKYLTDLTLRSYYSWHTFEVRKSALPKKRKRLKTSQNKGNTCQVFRRKPCHVTIIGTGFGFQHRRFGKLSHSSASSRRAATAVFCRHVAKWRFKRWKSFSLHDADYKTLSKNDAQWPSPL